MTNLAAQIVRSLDRAEETARAALAAGGKATGSTRQVAAHVGEWDPAHVLRLCAALREVVKLHAPEDGTDHCPTCPDRYPFHNEDPDAMHPDPCPTLTAVAAMFAEPGEES